MVSKTGNIIEMLGRQRESGKEGQRDTERDKKTEDNINSGCHTDNWEASLVGPVHSSVHTPERERDRDRARERDRDIR